MEVKCGGGAESEEGAEEAEKEGTVTQGPV